MAKHRNHTATMPHEPPRDEMLRYQAESFVRDNITKGTGFKAEVNRVLKELKRLDRSVSISPKKEEK